MSAVANIVLADALATPVNHTFVPVGQDNNGIWWFEDKSQANAIGFWKLSLQLKRPPNARPGETSATRNYRVKMVVYEPQLENVTNSTVSGVAPAPQLSYTVSSIHEFVMSERATLQNRQDLRKMAKNLIDNAIVVDMIEQLNNPY